MTSSSAIGFVGLGNMGKPMVTRIIHGGHHPVVFDIRKDAVDSVRDIGATPASSPKEVASRADIVLVSLPTQVAVQQVALGDAGLIHGNRFRVYVDLSTTGPTMAEKISEQLAHGGVASLDAPVSGGVPGAVSGSLSIMASGPKEVFERCHPILQLLAKNIFHVGPKVGQGQALKLINNFLSATAMSATSEALMLGRKLGLDARMMAEVINNSSGRNSATQDKFPKNIIPRKFDYGFRTSLMCKDLGLYADMAKELGAPISIGETVRSIWQLVLAEEGEESDFTRVARHFEKLGGVEIS